MSGNRQHCDACDDPDCQGFDALAIHDHPYRPDRQGQWATNRCDLCGEPKAAHVHVDPVTEHIAARQREMWS